MINKIMNMGVNTICTPIVQKFLNKLFNINPNDFVLGFKKVDGLWYSDIKNWPKAFEQRQLMVAGSDQLLEYLANGENYVTLHIKTKPFENSYHLHKIEEDEWGGTYTVNDTKFTIWLCNVTKFVMGQHPEDIYFEVCDN